MKLGGVFAVEQARTENTDNRVRRVKGIVIWKNGPVFFFRYVLRPARITQEDVTKLDATIRTKWTFSRDHSLSAVDPHGEAATLSKLEPERWAAEMREPPPRPTVN